jgi:hypothetical protein
VNSEWHAPYGDSAAATHYFGKHVPPHSQNQCIGQRTPLALRPQEGTPEIPTQKEPHYTVRELVKKPLNQSFQSRFTLRQTHF